MRPDTIAVPPPTSTALPSNSPSKKISLPRTTTSPARIVPFGMDSVPASALARDATRGARIRRRAGIAQVPVKRVRRLTRAPASAARRPGVETRGTPREPAREKRECASRREQGSGEPGPRTRRAPDRRDGPRERGRRSEERREASRRPRSHHARPGLERRARPERPEGSEEDGETGREERGRREGRNAPRARPADLPGGERTRGHDPGRQLPPKARDRRRGNTLIQNEFHATIPLQLLRGGRRDILNASAGALVHLDPLYDVPGQKISQGLSGTKELVLDRAERHALELGDLLVGHLAVVTKADELAVVVGQPVDGRREGLAKTMAGQLLVGIRARLGRIHDTRLAVLSGRALERQEADAPPPKVIDRGVSGDPEQPGRKLEARVEGVERGIHFDEDVLCDVAGIL